MRSRSRVPRSVRLQPPLLLLRCRRSSRNSRLALVIVGRSSLRIALRAAIRDLRSLFFDLRVDFALNCPRAHPPGPPGSRQGPAVRAADAPALVGRESRQLPLTRQHRQPPPLRSCVPGDGRLDLAATWAAPTAPTSTALRVTNRLQPQARRPDPRRADAHGLRRPAGRHAAPAAATSRSPAKKRAWTARSCTPSRRNDDSMVLAVPEPAAAAMSNLKLLYQLGAALGSSFDVDQVLEVVMDLVFEHVKADRGIILLLDEQTDELHAQGRPHARRGRRARTKHATATATPARRRRSTRRADGDEDPRLAHDHQPRAQQRRGRALQQRDDRPALQQGQERPQPRHPLGPVRADQGAQARRQAQRPRAAPTRSIGVIYIDSSVKNYTYSPDQLRLLTAIGLQAGMAIQNAKLYQQGLAGRAPRRRSARRPPRCRTRSRTSSRPCAAAPTSSRWASRAATSRRPARAGGSSTATSTRSTT